MRILKFIVANNSIVQDPKCDFSGLFPGRNKNVIARFDFSSEWDTSAKVVAFWSILGNEYTPQLLDEKSTCLIPSEALERPAFKMQVLGKTKHKQMETNKLIVYQYGGKT